MTKRNKGWLSTEKLTFLALLTALQIVLGNVTQLPFLGKQFTFGYLPIAAAGAMMGPVAAMIVGGLGDLVGAHLFPQGAYFAGFTLTNALVGLCYGFLLYRKKPSWLWVLLATVAMSFLNLFLNSLWLSLLYTSRAYWGWVSVRTVTYLIEAPFQIVLTYFTLRGLQKLNLPASIRINGGKDAHQKESL